MRTLRVLKTSTLSVVSAITLSIRSGCLSLTDRAPESSLRLSQWTPVSTVAFIWSPRQLLQSDTGVPHFALDPLTYRCLLSLSPAADFAEPRPPRHIPPPPDSGREALRPAAPPPPFLGEEVGYSHLRPRPVITLNLKGCNARYQRVIRGVGILHAVEPLQGGVVRTEGEFPSQEIIAEGEDPPTGLPNTPSQWCCTSSLS